ncbi:hypothetical protein MKQ70_01510 [Chitinophaga sedimenti]|uniref:hypothetical protein n=1 Tax=Chitinophaga sedimenti TaxID=2033606 RepID=UPI002004AE8F|nr:hypothetical protein [Chitinophaga sedimenti]MCK7553747.1 hypothetical protein [Chitinophaga sedimenti]
MKSAKILITACLVVIAAIGAIASAKMQNVTLYYYIDPAQPQLGTDSDNFSVSCPIEAEGCIVFVTKDGLNANRQLYTDAAAQHPIAPEE